MIEQGHLQVYTLRLKTLGPVHIGNGEKITKKGYHFNGKRISILNEEIFFSMLLQHGLVDQYEAFMMDSNALSDFLKDNGLSNEDWKAAVRYQVNAQDVLNDSRSLKDISCCIRDAYGRAYVPGSSIKGALRTIILQRLIQEDQNRDLTLIDKEIEPKYLNTLGCNAKNPQNMVNSILRGMQISDSLPIADKDVLLFAQYDSNTAGQLKAMPICREGIRPQTEIVCQVTLDQGLLQGRITKEWLEDAIDRYCSFYSENYASKFSKPKNLVEDSTVHFLYLGGGAGFFSKTIVYPYHGMQFALPKVIKKFTSTSAFRSHHHERDAQQGISPHTLKYTRLGNCIYLIGKCGVKFE